MWPSAAVATPTSMVPRPVAVLIKDAVWLSYVSAFWGCACFRYFPS
jgi:hypothetical protein